VDQKLDEILAANGDVNQRLNSKGMPDPQGINLLTWAVSSNDAGLVKELLERGAKPDLPPKPRAHWTPLYEAISGVQTDSPRDAERRIASSRKVIRALVSGGANVNHKATAGETPVMRAAGRGRADVCRFLASKGADVKVADALGRVGRLGPAALLQATAWAVAAHLAVTAGIAIAALDTGLDVSLAGLLFTYTFTTAGVVVLFAFPGFQVGWDALFAALLVATAGLPLPQALLVTATVRAQHVAIVLAGGLATAWFLSRSPTGGTP